MLGYLAVRSNPGLALRAPSQSAVQNALQELEACNGLQDPLALWEAARVAACSLSKS